MKNFFIDILQHLFLIFMLAVVLVSVILIGSFFKSCSPEEQAMAKAEAEAERLAEEEAVLDKIGSIYRRVYDKANEAYWELGNMYQDLYEAYRDDPGRTGSLDGFKDPMDLEGPLPDDVDWFLDD